jgi:chromosome segregation ATPase
VLGRDGGEKYVELNKPDPVTGKVLNDITHGKYDVTVTVGPSFATQRQEAAEIYMQLAQANPAIMQIAGDLIFKAVDMPYAEDIAARLKVMLPPQIQQMESEGKELPPEAMQAMAQASQAMEMVEQQAQALQMAQQEMAGEKATIQADKSEIQSQLVKLQAEKAVLDAHYREIMAKLDAEQAKAQLQRSGSDGEAEKVTLSAQLTEALAQIQAQAAEFMTQAAGVIAEMQARTQPQVVVADPPRTRRFVAERDAAGNLVGGVIQEVA